MIFLQPFQQELATFITEPVQTHIQREQRAVSTQGSAQVPTPFRVDEVVGKVEEGQGCIFFEKKGRRRDESNAVVGDFVVGKVERNDGFVLLLRKEE